MFRDSQAWKDLDPTGRRGRGKETGCGVHGGGTEPVLKEVRELRQGTAARKAFLGKGNSIMRKSMVYTRPES